MSTIRLYQVDFEPRDNFYIEDIEYYLSQLSSTSKRFNTDKANYLKLSMNIELKIPVEQEKQIVNIANYAVITQDDQNYYYFITNSRWVAKKTIAITLTLDTVQTFFNKLSWSKRTQITREHCNRLKKFSDGRYLRVIDKYTENMNPALTQQENVYEITDTIKNRWYLVYMSNPGITQEETNEPMFVGLISSFPYLIYNAVNNATITLPIQECEVFYITDSDIGDDAYIQVSNTKYYLRTKSDNNTLRAIKVYRTKDSTGLYIQRLYYTGNTYPYSYSSTSSVASFNTTEVTFMNIRKITKLTLSSSIIDYTTDYNFNIVSIEQMDSLKNITINSGVLPAVYLTSFNNFDVSNSRLYKIIELPYSPVSVDKNEEGENIFENCEYFYGYGILKFTGEIFKRDIKQDSGIQDLIFVDLPNPSATDEPNINLESKLYSSEFYDFSYIYDTERIRLRLEDFNFGSSLPYISVSYAQTNTMNSDKQFRLIPGNCSYNNNALWELYLNSSRSTEKLILNNSYLDYIRNGYNYDQWSAKQQQKISRTNAIISSVSSAVSFASELPGRISNIVSGISSINETKFAIKQNEIMKNLAYTGLRAQNYLNKFGKSSEASTNTYNATIGAIEAENAEYATDIKQKKQQVLNESTGFGSYVLANGISNINSVVNSVAAIESSKKAFINSINSRATASISASGNTPVDLFDNYSNNKLIHSEFTVRDIEKTNLWNMFRYLGYSHPLQEIPDFDSRIYSNFVQCTPAFNNEQTEVYKVYLDDIVQRFQAGVTIKHKYNNKYDLHDEYENYEKFILEDNA